MSVRVLRVYHSAVVEEYRQRERMLRERHGYDVHLVCPPVWQEGSSLVRAERDDDVPVHVVKVRGRRHPILFWYDTRALRRVVREFRPEIVDLHEEPYSLAVAAALRVSKQEAPGAAICLYSAQNILKRYPPPFRQIERRALAAADAAYPCSREAGEVLRAKGFRGTLHVLPLGVSIPDRRAPTGDEALRVGFVGRLEPYKGAEVALRAFAKTAEALDASLELVGSGSEEQRLRELANRLGVSRRVAFVGAVPQEEALHRIGRYDVLLVPSLTTRSWKEQFGRVAAQAMAAGTPVIASDCGSLPEVVGSSGKIVREGDVDQLALALAELLGDPHERQSLARRGRAAAVERLTWDYVAAGFDRMYRQAVEARGLADHTE